MAVQVALQEHPSAVATCTGRQQANWQQWPWHSVHSHQAHIKHSKWLTGHSLLDLRITSFGGKLGNPEPQSWVRAQAKMQINLASVARVDMLATPSTALSCWGFQYSSEPPASMQASHLD